MGIFINSPCGEKSNNRHVEVPTFMLGLSKLVCNHFYTNYIEQRTKGNRIEPGKAPTVLSHAVYRTEYSERCQQSVEESYENFTIKWQQWGWDGNTHRKRFQQFMQDDSNGPSEVELLWHQHKPFEERVCWDGKDSGHCLDGAIGLRDGWHIASAYAIFMVVVMLSVAVVVVAMRVWVVIIVQQQNIDAQEGQKYQSRDCEWQAAGMAVLMLVIFMIIIFMLVIFMLVIFMIVALNHVRNLVNKESSKLNSSC